MAEGVKFDLAFPRRRELRLAGIDPKMGLTFFADERDMPCHECSIFFAEEKCKPTGRTPWFTPTACPPDKNKTRQRPRLQAASNLT